MAVGDQPRRRGPGPRGPTRGDAAVGPDVRAAADGVRPKAVPRHGGRHGHHDARALPDVDVRHHGRGRGPRRASWARHHLAQRARARRRRHLRGPARGRERQDQRQLPGDRKGRRQLPARAGHGRDPRGPDVAARCTTRCSTRRRATASATTVSRCSRRLVDFIDDDTKQFDAYRLRTGSQDERYGYTELHRPLPVAQRPARLDRRAPPGPGRSTTTGWPRSGQRPDGLWRLQGQPQLRERRAGRPGVAPRGLGSRPLEDRGRELLDR